MTLKEMPTVKMTTNSSHDTALQPMSNYSIELTHRQVNSCEDCFSQPNHECLASMHAHPLFAGIGFDELKMIREDKGDGHELMKKSSHISVDAMKKRQKRIRHL